MKKWYAFCRACGGIRGGNVIDADRAGITSDHRLAASASVYPSQWPRTAVRDRGVPPVLANSEHDAAAALTSVDTLVINNSDLRLQCHYTNPHQRPHRPSSQRTPAARGSLRRRPAVDLRGLSGQDVFGESGAAGHRLIRSCRAPTEMSRSF